MLESVQQKWAQETKDEQKVPGHQDGIDGDLGAQEAERSKRLESAALLHRALACARRRPAGYSSLRERSTRISRASRLGRAGGTRRASLCALTRLHGLPAGLRQRPAGGRPRLLRHG